MSIEEIKKQCNEKMDKCINQLNKDLSAIRTGRANPLLLDKVVVDYYGAPTGLRQLAQVSVSEGTTLVITPFDKTILKDIEKAIVEKMTALRWLSYEIGINTSGASNELAAKCCDVLASDTLPILKKTKSGEAVVDIKPLVKSADVTFDGEKIQIKCVLSADASAFLNPEYVVKVLREKCGIFSSGNLISENYTILRTNAYREDMSEFK